MMRLSMRGNLEVSILFMSSIAPLKLRVWSAREERDLVLRCDLLSCLWEDLSLI